MAEGAAFVLIFDGIDETQRRQIQAAVERTQCEWFHRQPDVWIVIGGTLRGIGAWKELVTPFLRDVGGFVIVLALPSQGGRGYAAMAPSGWFPWLKEEFMNRPAENSAKEIEK